MSVSKALVLAAVAVAVRSGTASASAAQDREVTLDQAVALALTAHPAVVQARGDVRVARTAQREAVGNWLPQVTGQSGLNTSSTEGFVDPRTQRTISTRTSYSASLGASLVLFDGFRRPAQNRSARANSASAEASLVSQRFQVVLQTKQAFFNALAAEELVRVAQTRIERAAEQLRVTRDKLAAGSAIRSDTLGAFVDLANARLQLLNAETQRATAEANLARLIGIDGTVSATGDSTLLMLPELDTAALRAEAVRSSPEIEQAVAQARAAGAQVAVSRSQYLPSITASYTNIVSGEELDNLDNRWTAGISLRWPLFDGFTRESNITRSRASQDAALARAEDVRRQVNAQLTQQFAALTSAQARIDIARASSEAAAEALRVQQERYRLGVATIVEILSSQVSLDQAEVDLVQARLDFLLAKAQIEALVGREI